MTWIRTDTERIPFLLAVAEPDVVIDVLRALAESATVYDEGRPQVWASLDPQQKVWASLDPQQINRMADMIEKQFNG